MDSAMAVPPPALAPEQWRDRNYRPRAAEIDAWVKGTADRQAADDATELVATLRLTAGGDGVVVMSRAHETVLVPPPARHALAALALDGQPFGFTAADVGGLQRAAEWVARAARTAEEGEAGAEAAAVIRGIAARVSALLPPADSRAGA